MSSIYTPSVAGGWQRPRGAAGRVAAALAFLVLSPVGLSAQEAAPSPASGELSEVIRNRLEAGQATGDLTVAGRPLMAIRALPGFYRERAFRPAWIRNGRPHPEAGRLLEALKGAPDDGLSAEDYHLDALEALLSAPASGGREEEVKRLADLDFLLTDAFLVFGSHLLHGRVNPETVNPEWTADRRNADMGSVLRGALDAGMVPETLRGLRPPQPRYDRLRRALERHRELARTGGWPSVPEGAALEPGSNDPRVAVLRERLKASGDLRRPDPEEASGADPELYGPGLEAAVRRFQRRHGLDADGVVGSATLTALNFTPEERIRQLEVNLERWRWLPQDLGRRHIEVNIAGFSVQVVEDAGIVLDLRAVVGRAYRQTPSFTGRMSYLVFSPYWHVPPGIAANDKLPELRRRGGDYLREQRMTLLEQSTDRPVDPASVDWAGIGASEFNRRYRLRQSPGSWNALGGVKFMFPNKYNVYLHDTPSRELFDLSQRSFSSGCIRVERPAELAAYLLRGDPEWTPESIKSAMERDRERRVPLAEPLPVHLLYWTAWVDGEGLIHFRDDVYGRDRAVARALDQDPAEE